MLRLSSNCHLIFAADGEDIVAWVALRLAHQKRPVSSLLQQHLVFVFIIEEFLIDANITMLKVKMIIPSLPPSRIGGHGTIAL